MTRKGFDLVRRRAAAAVAAGALLAALGACGQLEPTAERDSVVEATALAADVQRYLVVARQGARPNQVTSAIAAAGGSVAREAPAIGLVAATSSDPDFLATVRGNRAIAAADPMPYFALPEVELGSVRMDLPSVDTAHPEPPAAFWDTLWGIARVQAPAAWERGVSGSHDTVVAVIDTGIASNHPDVGPNIVYDACFVRAGDHMTGDCLPYPSLSSHGTHVAGTIAGNFGDGVVGVGPDLGLANYNVFELFEVEPGEFAVQAAVDSVFAAMIDAADEGFDAINMSLGALVAHGPDSDNRDVAAFRLAVKRVADYVLRAGTVIVASAGNAAFDLTGPVWNLPGGVPGIVNVGATGIRPDPVFPQGGSFDVLAFYSNFGARVDMVAPGGDCGLPDDCDPATRTPNFLAFTVLSSAVVPNPTCAVTETCTVGWGFAIGTSMAAPHVAGAAGLVRDANPRLQPRQVHSLLQRTAEDIGHRRSFGSGMLDVDRATR